MSNSLVYLVIMILVGAISFGIFIKVNKANELQRSVAKRLNFKYDPPRGFLGFSNRDFRGFLKSDKTPHISGTYRGRSLRLGVFHIRGFTDVDGYPIPESFCSTIFMDIENPSNIFLSLKTARRLAPIAEVFGVKEIHIGHNAFDHHFTINSQPKDLATSLFQSSELRDQLMWIRFPIKILVQKNKLELQGTDSVEMSYFMIFDLLCELAEVIEEYSPC